MIGIAALVIGIVLGLVFQPSVSEVIQSDPPIAVAAALTVVFGGLRGSTWRTSSTPRLFVVFFAFYVAVGSRR